VARTRKKHNNCAKKPYLIKSRLEPCNFLSASSSCTAVVYYLCASCAPPRQQEEMMTFQRLICDSSTHAAASLSSPMRSSKFTASNWLWKHFSIRVEKAEKVVVATATAAGGAQLYTQPAASRQKRVNLSLRDRERETRGRSSIITTTQPRTRAAAERRTMKFIFRNEFSGAAVCMSQNYLISRAQLIVNSIPPQGSPIVLTLYTFFNASYLSSYWILFSDSSHHTNLFAHFLTKSI